MNELLLYLIYNYKHSCTRSNYEPIKSFYGFHGFEVASPDLIIMWFTLQS